MPNEQLIVQLPITDASDFDFLLYVEETLAQACRLNNMATVMGHEFAADRFDIIIRPQVNIDELVPFVRRFLDQHEQTRAATLASS